MKYSEEVILSKVLQFKHSSGDGHAVDNALENSDAFEQKFKNVCAKLPVELVDSLEATCGLLDFSKREFIHLAVTDLIEKFEEISSEYDMFGPHELQQEGGKTNV